MLKILKSPLECIYENYKKNTAKMLIATGTLGWGLSSLAQIGAVLFNPKISKEQKSYLVPQEALDAFVNIASFFVITQMTKKVVSKLASTGKIAPESVRVFLNKHKDLYGDKVGKLSLDLDKVLEKNTGFPKDSYYAYKNFATTVGTVGASIFASNIVTPVLRNTVAADIHNKYMNKKTYYPNSGGMKV